jgi:deazaflavin-dependent oxidoreductase (nitroreductase family)
MGSTRLMMLNTVGRRSGQQRVTPLLYIEDGSRWIVVASNGGTERVPGWWFNLCELPDASIQLGRATHRVTARPATAEETAALWPKLDAVYEFFDDYRQRTKRELPVVILERRASGAVAAPAASDAAASPASGG